MQERKNRNQSADEEITPLSEEKQELSTVSAEDRIAELENKLAALQKEKEELKGGNYCILATVPKMMVEVTICRPPFESVSKSRQVQKISIPITFRLCAAENGKDYGEDPKYPGQKFEESINEYPPDSNGFTSPVSIQFMQLAATRGKHMNMGIVFWDKNKESKAQARIRGIRNYQKFVNDMKNELRVRHMEIVTATGRENLPNKEDYEFTYPTQYEHFQRIESIKPKINELQRQVG